MSSEVVGDLAGAFNIEGISESASRYAKEVYGMSSEVVGDLAGAFNVGEIGKNISDSLGSSILAPIADFSESASRYAKEVYGMSLGAPGKLLDGISSLFGSEDVKVASTISATPTESPEQIRQKVAARIMADEPQTNNVSSKELTEIAAENEEQTELQRQLVGLFTQVLEALKPKPTPSTASGGEVGDTKPNQLASKPAKYFRNPLGSLAQMPLKATTNLGVPRV